MEILEDLWYESHIGLYVVSYIKYSFFARILAALIAEFFRKYGVADILLSFYQGFMSQQFVSLSWRLAVVFLYLLTGYPLYVKKRYIKL